MSRVVGVLAIVGLCALPAAHGESTHLTTPMRHALTPIGQSPTKSELLDLFPPTTIVADLTAIALDSSEDYFGLRLRAVRALPEVCLPSCAGSPARAALRSLLGYAIPNDPGKSVLFLRATIEALGKTADPADVDTILGYVTNASRDVRVAAAVALRDICALTQAQKDQLSTYHNAEPLMQVRLAIQAAIQCD